MLNNIAYKNGGGIFLTSSSFVEIINSVLMNNTARDGSGGGTYLEESSFCAITHSTVNLNRAHEGSGGGMYLQTSSAAITGTEFTSNIATRGGGVYANGCNYLMISNAKFHINTAHYGGAVNVQNIKSNLGHKRWWRFFHGNAIRHLSSRLQFFG